MSTGPLVFAATWIGLSLSFTFSLVLGVGLASGITKYQPYSDAWGNYQGGSSSGALLVVAFEPLGGFGMFCAVLIALGGIANTVPPRCSSGIYFQTLGRSFERVPRVIWNTIGVIIYTVCALAGRNSLAVIFTNFLALMGYWVGIWVAIRAEERLLFRRRGAGLGYDWGDWNKPDTSPVGLAAIAAFLIGWVGAIQWMAQVLYVGPIARLLGLRCRHGQLCSLFLGCPGLPTAPVVRVSQIQAMTNALSVFVFSWIIHVY